MATRDYRSEKEPIARWEFERQSWVTGEGSTAKTATLNNVVGTCRRIDIVISAVTDNPTVDVVFTDADGLTLFSFSGLLDGTHHVKLAESHKAAQDADFNPIPFCDDDITVSIDPSADPGGSLQTLTVDVKLFLDD